MAHRACMTVVLVAGLFTGACGDDGTTGDAAGIDGGGGTDSGGGSDAGGGSDSGSMDATGTTGCATPAGPMCPDGLMCCSGVPYPMEGICMEDCPARSDRAQKEAIEAVDTDDVLSRVASLPIHEWSYRQEGPAVRHMGPMAQDFHAAFGLGTDDRHIHQVDGSGVALAAIQALNRRVEQLEQQNRSLRRELLALRQTR